jgi:hypothetical protein
MQTIKLAGFALALAFAAACGGGGNKNVVEPDQGSGPGSGDIGAPVAGGCATEILLECADGMVDGCTNGTTTDHACVAADAKAGPDCAQEIALQCPDGQMDGCLTTPVMSSTHVCVVTK